MSVSYDPEVRVMFKSPCSKCGAGGRSVLIRYFKKLMFTMTEQAVRIFSRKSAGHNCCWKCKEKPEVSQVWGLVISNKERNRIFCPACSVFIQDKLDTEFVNGGS